jgi:hypothetical protein
MPQNNIGKPEMKRLLGRYKQKWENSKVDLREICYEGGDWTELIQDLSQWQVFVKMVMDFQDP